MRWTKNTEKLRHKEKLVDLLVWRTDCNRYFVVKLADNEYQFREAHPEFSSYPVLTQVFERLSDAKEFAEKQEQDRLKVWHYFVEAGTRVKQEADAWVANPVAVCEYMKQQYAKDASKSLQAVIDDGYAYHKMRAHMRTDPQSYCWNKMLDPAAARDWQARLSGDYVQWWERKKV